MRDYIEDHKITPEEFQQLYKMDHGFDLTRLQKEAIGIETKVKVRNRKQAYSAFGSTNVYQVDIVRGKKREVRRYGFTKDKRGQYHRVGKDGRWEHLTKADRKGLGLTKRSPKVKRSSLSDFKKRREEGSGT